MRDHFTMRFILSSGVPGPEALLSFIPEGLALQGSEEGRYALMRGTDTLAWLNLLPATDPRGKTMLRSIMEDAARHAEAEALATVRFVVENAPGVVVAQPFIASDEEVEEVLEPLDALWEGMFETHGGLLQVDDEGIYDHESILVSFPE